MVNTCVVPECTSGYRSNKSNKYPLHRFPADRERRKIWEHRIPRKNWTSSLNSVICGRHFLPSDYVNKRDDKQSRRVKRKGTDLAYRKVKLNAVPSVWPGLPPLLTKPPPIQRPTSLACSASRQENVEGMEICREVPEKAKDSVSSLQRFYPAALGVDLPINAIINQGDRLLFASIEYTNKPEIYYCLCIKEDLEYELWVRGNKIKKKSIATDDIPSLPPQLMSIEVLKKILTFLKTVFK